MKGDPGASGFDRPREPLELPSWTIVASVSVVSSFEVVIPPRW